MGRFKGTPGPRATLVGAVLMWLGVVIVAGAHAPTRQDNSIAPNGVTASAPKSTSPTPADPSKATAGGYRWRREVPRVPRGSEGLPRDPAWARGEPAHAGREEQVRELPRSWQGARRRGRRRPHQGLTKMSPRQAGETCVTCHDRSEHNNWAGGKHDSRNMSCATCHSVHAPKSLDGQLKTETVTETCVQCHKRGSRQGPQVVAHAGRAKARWNARPATTRTARRT